MAIKTNILARAMILTTCIILAIFGLFALFVVSVATMGPGIACAVWASSVTVIAMVALIYWILDI